MTHQWQQQQQQPQQQRQAPPAASHRKDAYELDMQHRDPFDHNEYLLVDFEDVFAEPSGAHAFDCVWRNTFRCYSCWKNCWYKTLTVLCALCAGAYWGCSFAQLACCHVYCCTPSRKTCGMEMRVLRECMMYFNEATWGTCCTVAGNFLSRIRVQRE